MAGRQDVLAVDKDLYDAMVAAYARVKDERFRNRQLSDNLVKQVSSIAHDIDSFSSKVAEASSNVQDLQESLHSLSEEHVELRIRLGEKVEAINYGVCELEDKLHKISKELKQLQLSVKPLQDAYKG
jgi:chromosome segregation ATPase